MASRDLTSQFVEYRNAANIRRREGGGGGGGGSKSFGISKKKVGASDYQDDLMLHVEEGGGGTSSESSHYANLSSANTRQHTLPPKWVDDVDAIHTTIKEITRLTDVLNSLHASRLSSVFGKNLDDLEGQIDRLTRQITDLFRVAERHLQKVGSATKKSGTSRQEATVGANIQRSLAKKLQELSMDFRQKQRQYLRDVQIQKRGGVEDGQAIVDQFGIDFNAQDQAPPPPSGGGFVTGAQDQKLALVDDLTQAAQSRDAEIAQIAQSIEELGSIFKELAVLVIDQGTILDRIDYNMEAVVEHTREGITQLEKAESQQKSARPMKCIFCLLSTIAVLLLILILKHRHRR